MFKRVPRCFRSLFMSHSKQEVRYVNTIVERYIRLRGVQAKLAVARQNLEIARQSQQLTETRFETGLLRTSKCTSS